MMPENIRRNHERTDDCIATIAGLMDAYSIIQTERPEDSQGKVAQSAKSTRCLNWLNASHSFTDFAAWNGPGLAVMQAGLVKYGG